MEFIFPDDQNFASCWSKFVSNNNQSTWAYLPKRIKFYKYYLKDKIKEDLSFIIVMGEKPICICLLFLECKDGMKSFTFANGYLKAPLFDDHLGYRAKKKVEKLCFSKINELAKVKKVSKVMLSFDPLSDQYSFNPLVIYGYLDSSIHTSVIDLEIPEEHIWSKIRKSYRSLINQGNKTFKIVIVDYANLDFDIFTMHRELHFKSAGLVTRSLKTWDIQFDMIKDDNACLIGLVFDSQFVAFSYFVHCNKKAYYGNSSDDPDCKFNIPFEHTITWSAIRYYKSRRFKKLETGLQQFGHQIFDHPTKKDLNISFFKRGFGGHIIPVHRGIKYFDKALMKTDLSKNMDKILKIIE